MSIDVSMFLMVTLGPIGGTVLAIAVLYAPKAFRTIVTGRVSL